MGTQQPATWLEGRAKWRAFGAIALTYITIVFATSMAFLVLPAIAEDFDVTLRAVGWVVIVEALIVSALLLPIGGVADAIGRRRVLFTGMVVFAIGAVLTGLAPNFVLLIVARIVMAVGNTMVQSVGTGLLVAIFPPHERGLALGAQTTAVAIGSATGPLITGVALDVLSWKTLFILIAIPAAVAAAAVWSLIDVDDADRNAAGRRRFDRVGGALSALMVTMVVLTINDPFDLGWLSPWILGGAVLAAVLMAAFVRWELREPQPMLELRLFALSIFRTAVAIRLIGFVSATTTTFLLPIYLLSLRDISSGRAGLIISLVAVGMGLSAQLSGRIYDRSGPRLPTVVGLAMQIAVNLALAFAGGDTSLWLLAFIAVVNGIAVGLWNVPNNSAMLGATPREALGVGGAFTNVTRTMGNVLGQAIAAAVVVAVMTTRGFDIPLGELDETFGAGDAFLSGWRVAFIVAAAISLLTLVIATRLPGRHDSSVGDPADANIRAKVRSSARRA